MKIDTQLLSEIRDFLQDISTGAPVTDASRDAATEFVALLPEEFDTDPTEEKQMQPLRLKEFLFLIKNSPMYDVPQVWGEELRTALSDRLVRVGFGGRLELTENGQVLLVSR